MLVPVLITFIRLPLFAQGPLHCFNRVRRAADVSGQRLIELQTAYSSALCVCLNLLHHEYHINPHSTHKVRVFLGREHILAGPPNFKGLCAASDLVLRLGFGLVSVS